jgi:hypothetical protein
MERVPFTGSWWKEKPMSRYVAGPVAMNLSQVEEDEVYLIRLDFSLRKNEQGNLVPVDEKFIVLTASQWARESLPEENIKAAYKNGRLVAVYI